MPCPSLPFDLAACLCRSPASALLFLLVPSPDCLLCHVDHFLCSDLMLVLADVLMPAAPSV